LSAIDQKIEVVAQQIEQAKQWKKGFCSKCLFKYLSSKSNHLIESFEGKTSEYVSTSIRWISLRSP
jgi:hypothetical protein